MGLRRQRARGQELIVRDPAMSELDYGKLSRQQKLAIFLIIIGPEAAAEVLRQFDDTEIELICREMSTFTVIPIEVLSMQPDTASRSLSNTSNITPELLNDLIKQKPANIGIALREWVSAESGAAQPAGKN